MGHSVSMQLFDQRALANNDPAIRTGMFAGS